MHAAYAQFVVLVAGCDMRCYRQDYCPHHSPTCCKIDVPSNQATTKEHLQVAGMDSAHVGFIPVDFNSVELDCWSKLRNAAFDQRLNTLFIAQVVLFTQEGVRVQHDARHPSSPRAPHTPAMACTTRSSHSSIILPSTTLSGLLTRSSTICQMSPSCQVRRTCQMGSTC